jgi:hypothetical protein
MNVGSEGRRLNGAKVYPSICVFVKTRNYLRIGTTRPRRTYMVHSNWFRGLVEWTGNHCSPESNNFDLETGLSRLRQEFALHGRHK